jgi:o-succinylbenzoate synthase
MKIDSILLRELQMSLVHPFTTSFGQTTKRRVLLVEIRAEGLSGWGECTATEHPYFNEESTDTAWLILRQELAPMLAAASEVDHPGKCPEIFRRVRGNRMAKAAIENAVWDLEAQMRGMSLAELLGGTIKSIACGVSIGIQPTLEQQLEKVETEVAAGYRRIKLKCKPGWDVNVFEAVRDRWPGITLSCDANSAYRLRDSDHLASFDRFGLLMIEQPLWADDFYFHSMLQNRLTTSICLDESIRNRRDALAAIEMGSCRIINVKLGRVGGFGEAIAIHNATQERGVPVWCGGMLETGIGRSHNIALSTLPNFTLPGDVSASRRYWAEDIIEPEVEVSKTGEIQVPTGPGRGYEVRPDLIDRLTVRKEEVRAMQLVS